MSENTKRKNNVRQLGSEPSNMNGQNQILTALDTLGAKLVRSESERETMRQLLNEALEAQDRLETNIERTQIHIERRIDQIEDDNSSLSDDDKAFIEGQKEVAAINKELLEDQVSRQLKVEDQLRDSLQTIQKMQRRLDAQEQKRARLQRRIERVENIAADAQNALEAKALVLLTDQTEQVQQLQLLQQQQTAQAMQVLDHLHTPTTETSSPSWIGRAIKGSGSTLAIVIAMGLGWSIANSLNTPPTFIISDKGQITQLDQAVEMTTTSPSITDDSNNAETVTLETPPASIDEDITATDQSAEDVLNDDKTTTEDETLSTDITPVEDIEAVDITTTAFDVLQTLAAEDITIDRDLSLPDAIKDLEDKAFDRIAEAQHDLAALYTAGQAGVNQNYERAAFWFKQSAQKGIGNAAYNLGVLYQQGLGQTQDLQRALDWYRRAAQLNHPEAQYNLGIAYIEGVGTRYNPNVAAAYFAKAADGNISEAAYNLGLILENGLLGKVKKEDALTWYKNAANAGNTDAQQALSSLAKELNINIDDISDTPANLDDLIPNEAQILTSQIQEQLRKAGLYTGMQDGIIGPGTIKAIRSYQRQNDIGVNGQVSTDLLNLMLYKGTN